MRSARGVLATLSQLSVLRADQLVSGGETVNGPMRFATGWIRKVGAARRCLRARGRGRSLAVRTGNRSRTRLLSFGLGVGLVLSSATGCGTLITQVDGPLFAPGQRTFDWDEKAASPIYSGTRLSWGGIRKSAVFYVWIVDLPLSFVADTAFLPLSIPQDLLSRLMTVEEEEVLQPEATPTR